MFNKVVLIISGGIAAYKSLELIRLLVKNNTKVKCVATESALEFVTPATIEHLSGETLRTSLNERAEEIKMGHIELAAPVAHIWFLRSLPSRIGLMMDMTLRQIEKVLYFEAFIVVDGGLTPYETGTLLNEEMYNQAIEEYGNEIKVGMGAEAIKELLQSIDLEKAYEDLSEEIKVTKSQAKNKRNSRIFACTHRLVCHTFSGRRYKNYT